MRVQPFLIVVAVLATSCGSSGGIEVSDGWARTTPPGTETAAFYVAVENTGAGADRLLAASTSACNVTQIHISEMNDEGVMSMRQADPEMLELDPGEQLLLEPGGLHVMCMGLIDPLESGDSLTVTMSFETAGDVLAEILIDDR